MKNIFKKGAVFALAFAGLMAVDSKAQLAISTLNTAGTINFSGFDGSGFASSPSAGQLDSDTWAVSGMSDGSVAFGGSGTSGDFARGSSSGGETTGGIYAFDVGLGNIALGVQPGGSDWTPGDLTLRVQNNTGATVTSWNLSYDIFVYNDQNRANSFNFSWSTDDTTYNSIAALDYTSTATADTTPAWVSNARSTTGLAATVAAGDFLYLRWTGNDVSGSGSRDEFGLDNVSVTAVPEPSTFVLLLSGLVGLFFARRRR